MSVEQMPNALKTSSVQTYPLYSYIWYWWGKISSSS